MASYTDITAVRSKDGGSKWAFDYEGISYNTVYQVIEHPTNGTLYAAVSSIHDMYQSTYLTDSKIDGGTGAILYSTDQGLHWNMLHDFGHPVVWLVIDPTNANRMYASVVNSTSGGIYITNNLNNSASSIWNITSTPSRTEGHPYNIQVLGDGTVVTTWSGRRASGAFTASSGVFISTDQGASWQDRSDRPNMDYWTKDITIDPNDASQNTWYVAVFSGWGGPSNDKGGLYKSTDRGLSWNKIFDGYRVESCTVDPVNASKVFVTTENEGLWYSSDANTSNPQFTQQTSYNFMHPMRVIYNPNDYTKIWVTSFGNGIKYGEAPSIPLAIHDLEFAGQAGRDGNHLMWNFIRDEEPILSLSLQKSKDGYWFEDEYVQDKPTKNFGRFVDTHPDHLSYYRLRVNYPTGRMDYSRIITIINPHIYQIEVFPTIASDRIYISHLREDDKVIKIKIFDIQGKLVINLKSLFATDETQNIGISRLLPGMYCITVSTDTDLLYSGKFIKK